MKRLHQMVFVELALGGIICFAVLWHSPFPVSAKILVGILLMFLGSIIYLVITEYLVLIHSQRQIAARLAHMTPESYDGGESSSQWVTASEDFTIQDQPALAKFLIWLLSLWLFGGWVISRWL